jgi:uncharacterized protein (UPF0335 family)
MTTTAFPQSLAPGICFLGGACLYFRARFHGKSMLTIRKEQFEVFQKASSKQFQQRMISHLRKVFVERTAGISDDNLRALIEAGIERARQYKVVLEDDVQRFLESMIVYGQDFDSNPRLKWARSALRAHNITGTEKMDVIEKHRKEGA